MLENSSLLLRPVLPGTDPQQGGPSAVQKTVLILDPATEQPLGLARSSFARNGLLRWFSPSFVQVFETEDHSLVCSLRRAWRLSPSWAVFDSENYQVGTVIDVSRRLFHFGVGHSDARAQGVRLLEGVSVEDSFGRRLAAFVEEIGRREERGDQAGRRAATANVVK